MRRVGSGMVFSFALWLVVVRICWAVWCWLFEGYFCGLNVGEFGFVVCYCVMFANFVWLACLCLIYCYFLFLVMVVCLCLIVFSLIWCYDIDGALLGCGLGFCWFDLVFVGRWDCWFVVACC